MPDIIHRNPRSIRKLLILLFWLGIWQIGAFWVGNDILLVGPLEVVNALITLIPSGDFWKSVVMTFGKISAGFMGAFFAGVLIGWIAYELPFLQDFLAPVTTFIKSVPVASFVILALIWMGSRNLSVFISFLVVFPMIYQSTVSGLSSTDDGMLEMARLFHITGWRKIRALYWPALLPFLRASCRTALGMSWKSGIAAEVIGVPDHTIGERLYLAKIYLSTAELFAWTLVIIVVSAVFEHLFLWLLGWTDNGRLMLPEMRKGRSEREISGKGDNRKAESGGEKAGSGIHIQSLSKAYGELTVLADLTADFPAGSRTCLMGPSGSGKTTLLRLIAGLEAADAGYCAFVPDHIDRSTHMNLPERLDLPSRKAKIPADSISQETSMVFQENRLFEIFSPLDNLRLAAPAFRRSDAKALLLKLLPEECLTRPVSTLSGGMKRRCAIARALAYPASIILMDEPFTGLDEETKEQVIEVILKCSTNRLLLISTHQAEDVKLLGAALYQMKPAK